MSTINANGTMVFGNTLGGSVTIAPKNDTTTNYTLSIPDVTAQVAVGRANDSAVMTALNATGSAPIYGCRAWLNYNGTSPAIRASGNISSVTKNGTGDYTINLTIAMPDANYTSVLTGTQNSGGTNISIGMHLSTAKTASSFRILQVNSAFTLVDSVDISAVVFK